MRLVIAAVLVALAVGIAVVPQFTDCQSQGKSIATANGKQVPMKCHWTGQAELALALPVASVGLLQGFRQSRRSRNALGISGAVLGLAVLLVPTSLIGVCSSPDMLCHMVMRPALILGGALISAGSLASIFVRADPMDGLA
jgi:hypothetical protein